jgi:hypothetical protein
LIGGGPPTTNRPLVTFTAPVKGGGTWNYTVTFSVAGASEPTSTFASFRAQIQMDNTPLVATSQGLVANRIISFGTSVKLVVRDFAGDGNLNGQDSFLIYGMTVGHTWKFSLIWVADGGEVNSSNWSTP